MTPMEGESPASAGVETAPAHERADMLVARDAYESTAAKGLAAAGTSPSVRFPSPFADATDRWLPAGTVADIPPLGIRVMTIGGEPVLLWRSGEDISCLQNACAHQGFPLDRGIVAGGTIICPRHGFAYELASGECLTVPGVQLRSHGVRVIGEHIHVRLTH